MRFSEIQKGQILGATFADDDSVLPEFRGKKSGYKVLDVRGTEDSVYSQTVMVEHTKTRERTTFVNSQGWESWRNWELVEPAHG